MTDRVSASASASASAVTVGRAWSRGWARLSGSAKVLAVVGVVLISIIIVSAIAAPLIAQYPPRGATGPIFARPSAAHWLGTDDLGQDLFAQLLHGARASVFVGLTAAGLAITIGTVVALLAGYMGGKVDAIAMRIVDLTLSLPFLVLVLVLATYFGRGLGVMVALIAGVLWARPARVLRGEVRKIATMDHVVAARAMGASNARVLGRHVLPRMATLLSSQMVRAAAVAVLVQSGVAFLGLGDPGRISWGAMLFFANTSNAILTDAWKWWILPPGLALTLLIMGFAFIGYAAEEWAEPRLTSYGYRRPRVRRLSPDTPAPQRDATVLEIRGLSVDYVLRGERITAVDGVDLTVRTDRVLGLVGESGSGKSTLAAALAGLLPHAGDITAGEVMFGGRDLRRLGRVGLAAIRGRELAVVPQAAMGSLNPTATAHRQVAETAALTMSGEAAGERATQLLERVGIHRERHRAFPHELSGGMRQRVVIAMALANSPRLLVADEPAHGLDVVTQVEIMQLLAEVRSTMGVELLLVSHDLDTVGRVAHDIVVLYAGRVVEAGPTDEVLKQPRHPYTRLLLEASPVVTGPRRELRAVPGEPPDLANRPAGCCFAERCPLVEQRCRVENPVLVAVGGDEHAAACHLLGAPGSFAELTE